MQSHKWLEKETCACLPEALWKAACQRASQNETPPLNLISHNHGLWEYFNFSGQCSALVFHAHSPCYQQFDLNQMLASQHIWVFDTCEVSLKKNNTELKSPEDKIFLLNRGHLTNTTFKTKVGPDSGFILIRLPKNITIARARLCTRSDTDIEALHLSRETALISLTKDIFHQRCHPDLRQHIVHGKIYEIINAIVQTREGDSHGINNNHAQQSNELAIAHKAEDILKKQYATPPSLTQLAKQIGTNRNKLCQSFKATYGKTISEYCTQYRMRLAKQMLSNNGISIAHVAELVGYEYPGNFTSAYKRYFGELPKSTKRFQSV